MSYFFEYRAVITPFPNYKNRQKAGAKILRSLKALGLERATFSFRSNGTVIGTSLVSDLSIFDETVDTMNKQTRIYLPNREIKVLALYLIPLKSLKKNDSL